MASEMACQLAYKQILLSKLEEEVTTNLGAVDRQGRPDKWRLEEAEEQKAEIQKLTKEIESMREILVEAHRIEMECKRIAGGH